jgi:ribosome-associated protein
VSAGALAVDSDLSIPRHELTFRATRAGGPGGQHVNTSSTRIELEWNVERSRAVTEEQRSRLRSKLSNRLDAQGHLRIVASAFRSQARNREDAEQRLSALVRRALAVPRPRKKTRPTRGSVEQRLQSKKKLSEKKGRRRDLGQGFE